MDVSVVGSHAENSGGIDADHLSGNYRQGEHTYAAKYNFTDGELCDHYRSPIGSRRDLGLFQVNFYGFLQEFILQEINP